MDSSGLLAALSRRARELRAEHSWTLRELDERSKLSQRFLIQMKSDRGNISIRRLAGLAQALGTTPTTLLTDPDDELEIPVIALLGLRRAGKTTLDHRLARRLRIPFVELDHRIEATAGLTLG